MAWWNNIISAVQNYFAPKSTPQTSWPSAPTPSYNKSTPSYTSQIVRKSYPSYTPPKTTPSKGISPPSSNVARGVNVQGPTYSSGGGNQGGVPSTTSTNQPQGDILADGIATIENRAKQFINNPAQKLKAELGRGITAAGNVVSAVAGKPIYAGGLFGQPGQPLGAPTTQEADRQMLIEDARRAEEERNLNQIWLRNLPAADAAWARKAAGLSQSDITIARNLWEALNRGVAGPSNVKTGAVRNLPSQQGQILPSAAKTGAPMQISRGIMQAPIPTPRGSVVPSAIDSSTLPANMQGLSQSNVNPALASSITPEAIQSIGQMLLRNLLGNQSSLTSMSPGLAQALWGAPTMGSAFGGYEGGAAVPSQTNIEQSKNLPPVPQALNQG